MILRIVAIALPSAVLLAITPASPEVGPPFVETGTIEIVTTDEDGELRETPVWIVVLDGQGYVRTNDSRWLANIRRGSPVTLRVGANEMTVAVAENEDPRVYDRVEEAFKTKYGFMQRVMSTFRISTPTVLELTHP